MGRLFNGTSDYLQSASAIDLSAYSKIALSFWLWWDAFDNLDDLAFEFGSGSNVAGAFQINPNSSFVAGKFIVVAMFGAGAQDIGSIVRPSAAAWHHYVINIDFGNVSVNSITQVYVDATSQTVGDEATVGTSSNAGNLTLNCMCRNGTTLFGAGRQADLAIYGGIALSQTDATNLNGGTLPTSVQSGSLVWYDKVCGDASPEPATIGGVDLTVSGTTQTAHPSAVSSSCGGGGPATVYAPGNRMVGVAYYQG